MIQIIKMLLPRLKHQNIMQGSGVLFPGLLNVNIFTLYVYIHPSVMDMQINSVTFPYNHKIKL
jgi:hypothetical protein